MPWRSFVSIRMSTGTARTSPMRPSASMAFLLRKGSESLVRDELQQRLHGLGRAQGPSAWMASMRV